MKTAFTLFIICFFGYSSSAQKAGTLDSSFGIKGKRIIDPGLNNSFLINNAVLQPDGKIIQVGNYEPADIGGMYGFVAIRSLPDGAIDSSFGTNGVKVTASQFDYAEALSVTVQEDNKIILAGYGSNGFLHPVFYGVLVRLNPDGSLDSSFGINGIVSNSYTNDVSFNSVVLQPDGKIIAAGSSGSFQTIISRYLVNGTPDQDFGDRGNSATRGSIIFSSALQRDGKIVLGGSTNGTVNPNFLLLRYSTNGMLDNTFGINGQVITDFNNTGSQILSLVIDLSDNIIATGINHTIPPQHEFAIARYTKDGVLDNSFGNEGMTAIPFGGDSSGNSSSVALQTDGKIVLAGNVVYNANTAEDYALIRLQSDGTIDNSFGVGGKVITDFGLMDEANAVMLQKDGKIIAAGRSILQATLDASIARYNNDDLSKKQTIIKKIKHYAATHNNVLATSLNSISIYPNPAQNVLHVAGLSLSETTLTVVDFMGNVKLQTVANASSYNLNIAALTPGNYLLKIEMNDAIVTKKFVKE